VIEFRSPPLGLWVTRFGIFFLNFFSRVEGLGLEKRVGGGGGGSFILVPLLKTTSVVVPW